MTHPDGAPFSAAQNRLGPMRACAGLARLRPAGDPRSADFFISDNPWRSSRTALRACASAPMISEIASALSAATALAPPSRNGGRDLDALFEKWRRLMEEERRP